MCLCMQESPLGVSGVLAVVIARLLLQPLMSFFVLSPLWFPRCFKGRWYCCFIDTSQFALGEGYKLNRLLLLASALQYVYALRFRV